MKGKGVQAGSEHHIVIVVSRIQGEKAMRPPLASLPANLVI
jgi:hypothetical protein